MNKFIFLIPIILSLVLIPTLVDAHQPDCHDVHSCPSDADPPTYQCGDKGDNQYCPVRVNTDKSVYERGEFMLIQGTVNEKIYSKVQMYQVQISMNGGGVSQGMSSQIDSKNQFMRAYVPYNHHNQDSNYTLTITYGNLTGITTFTVLD